MWTRFRRLGLRCHNYPGNITSLAFLQGGLWQGGYNNHTSLYSRFMGKEITLGGGPRLGKPTFEYILYGCSKYYVHIHRNMYLDGVRREIEKKKYRLFSVLDDAKNYSLVHLKRQEHDIFKVYIKRYLRILIHSPCNIQSWHFLLTIPQKVLTFQQNCDKTVSFLSHFLHTILWKVVTLHVSHPGKCF